MQSPGYVAGWLSVTFGHQQAPTGSEGKKTKKLEYFFSISSLFPPSFISVLLAEATFLWDARSNSRAGTGLLSFLLQHDGNTSCIAYPCLGASPSFIGFLNSALISVYSPLVSLIFESYRLNPNPSQCSDLYKDENFYQRAQNFSKYLPWVILWKRSFYGQISVENAVYLISFFKNHNIY